MITLGENNDYPEKVKIDYPCEWTYKVIGEDCTLLKEAITKACGGHTPAISHSQTSKSGKYDSLEVKVNVPSEEMRLDIFGKLQAAPAVKFVL